MTIEIRNPAAPEDYAAAIDVMSTAFLEGEAPDLTLPIEAIGAAYLGGTRPPDAVRQTGADEHRAGALADADALFRTADEPWCSTSF
jgi:hypothetical protein